MVATAGVISVKDLKPRSDLTDNFWATSACIAAGNDGGALIDKMGRLVGICLDDDNYFAQHRISLVMPVSTAVQIMKEIMAKAARRNRATSESIRSETLKWRTADLRCRMRRRRPESRGGSPAERPDSKPARLSPGSATRPSQRSATEGLVAAADIGSNVDVIVRDVDGSVKTLQVE